MPLDVRDDPQLFPVGYAFAHVREAIDVVNLGFAPESERDSLQIVHSARGIPEFGGPKQHGPRAGRYSPREGTGPGAGGCPQTSITHPELGQGTLARLFSAESRVVCRYSRASTGDDGKGERPLMAVWPVAAAYPHPSWKRGAQAGKGLRTYGL